MIDIIHSIHTTYTALSLTPYSSLTLASTEVATSREQVQCLSEWLDAGGSKGRAVSIGGTSAAVREN